MNIASLVVRAFAADFPDVIEALKKLLTTCGGAACEKSTRAQIHLAIGIVQAAGKKDMGKVMKELQARHGASYDGKAASQLVQSLLN